MSLFTKTKIYFCAFSLHLTLLCVVLHEVLKRRHIAAHTILLAVGRSVEQKSVIHLPSECCRIFKNG